MRARALVVLLVAAAVALGIATNVVDARLLPWGVRGDQSAIGEDVDVPPFQIHVNGVRVAEAVITPDLYSEPVPIESPGVWVVVDLSYATTDAVGSPSGAALVLRDDQGREYQISSRADEGEEWIAGPDIWLRGSLTFEVAPDAVDSLVLVFDPLRRLYGDMPVEYAIIPLELDGVEVQDVVEVLPPEILDAGER